MLHNRPSESDNHASCRVLAYSRFFHGSRAVWFYGSWSAPSGSFLGTADPDNPRAADAQIRATPRRLVTHDSPTISETFSWSGWHSYLGIFQVIHILNMSTTYICIFKWQWHSLAGVHACGLQRETLRHSPFFLLMRVSRYRRSDECTHSGAAFYCISSLLFCSVLEHECLLWKKGNRLQITADNCLIITWLPRTVYPISCR